MAERVRNLNPDVWRFRHTMGVISDPRADIRLVPGWFHGLQVEIIVHVSRDVDGLHGLPMAILITADSDDAVVIEPPHTI